MSEYLFPRRLTRRDFLEYAGATTAIGATAAWPSLAGAEDKPKKKEKEADKAKDEKAAEPTGPIVIGEGKWRYTVDPNWGKLPEGMKFGLGCGIAIDGKERIYVTSRSQEPCVAIFDTQGKLLEAWTKDFADKVGFTTKEVSETAHGLYWSKEGDNEYLYFTENKSSDKNSHQGRRVYKTDLQGKILYTLGNVQEENSTSQKFQFDNPTDVAVAANGDIYIVDGYGSQLVHRFDKNFKLIKTIGGHGTDHGKFETCHGVWINTLKSTPEVYIADRANNRLEIYSLELDYKRTIPDMRLPCCFYQHAGHIYVPELGSRVSILDADDKVVAQLGDGKDVPPKEREKHPEKFFTPHALTVDSQGNFYLVEWLAGGRVRKMTHTPA